MNVPKQFGRFATVGFIATVTTYAVLIFMVEKLQIGAVSASFTGYLVGGLVNYTLNYRFTFRSSNRHQSALPRFVIVLALGLLLNTAIMFLAVDIIQVHYLFAQLIAVSIVLVWSYASNKLWAFSN